MADWARHVIWWHVYPLGFLGAEPTADAVAGQPPRHRLRDLEPWLDYLVELGANGLALGPVFAAETHGYDTVDHFAVDPRLGTEDDLLELVEGCHRRGVRVLLDGVFNHVGRGFPAFRDVLDRGRGSPYASWFRLDFDADGPDGFGYADFEGHRHLVRLNHDEPAVADHVARVMAHWCGRGVDGWRLDAAYAVPPRFWRPVLERVRADHPGVWVVGEMIHGDYAGYVRAAGLDSVTQYELWKAVWSSLNDRNPFELAHALRRHADLLPEFLPQTFVGNHDVTRLATRVDDPRHLGHALAVLFTTPGVPSVYYGDEQGLQGRKEDRPGGDDAVRPAFPSSPAALPEHGAHAYGLHRQLVALRRRHGWVNRAVLHEPDVLTNEVLAYRVAAQGEGTLTVVLNVADGPARVAADPAARVDAGTAERHGGAVEVAPHGWAVLTGPAG